MEPQDLSLPVLHDIVDITYSKDKTPYPDDVTVLKCDGAYVLVVADSRSSSLISFELTNTCRSVLKLSEIPHRVAKMSNNQVAATTDRRKIALVKVKPHLSLIKYIKTMKHYIGLSSLSESTAAAGAFKPVPAVDILDLAMDGVILKSFTPDNTHPALMQCPDYICTTNGGNILVSDPVSKSVYCLTQKGTVVFKYSPTGNPQGVTITRSGDILLADSESRKIVQLTSNGTFLRDILPSTWGGIDSPLALCCDDAEKLYVCPKEDKTNIKVLCLSRSQACLSGAFNRKRDSEAVSEVVEFSANKEPVKKAMSTTNEVSLIVNESESNRLFSPKLHDIINIKDYGDIKYAYPNDITVLEIGSAYILVIADCERKLISLQVRSTHKSVSVLELKTVPHRVVKISENQVAATIDGCNIVLVEVSLQQLTVVKTLETKKNYTGLSSLPGSKLAVGTFVPTPAVDILDLDGNVLESFTPDNKHIPFLQCPDYLFTTREGNILVSDPVSKSVYCLTPKGAVVFTYQPTGKKKLDNPQGVTITNSGDILLADSGSKKIVQLTSNGVVLGDILPSTWQGTDAPLTVFCDDNNKLIVSQKKEKCLCKCIITLLNLH